MTNNTKRVKVCQVKYVAERNEKTLALLDKAKAELPAFCNRFFLGVSETMQPLTRLNYAYDLGVFFDFLSQETDTFHGKKRSEYTIEDLDKVEVLHVELYVDWLSATNSKSGKMRKLSCLRSFFAYYFKKGQISKNILPNIDLPKLQQKSIVRLDKDEASRIIESAKFGSDLTEGQRRFHRRLGTRDTMILHLFLSTGMRVSELVGLNVEDVALKNSALRITRKGGNESILFMTPRLKRLVGEHLHNILYSTSDKQYNIDLDKPLFTSLHGKRICVRSVQNLVKKYASTAAPLKNISPHKLRSTFGTNLYKATGDIYAVADVLGHQNVNTTKKHYAAITDDIRRDAMAKFEENN